MWKAEVDSGYLPPYLLRHRLPLNPDLIDWHSRGSGNSSVSSLPSLNPSARVWMCAALLSFTLCWGCKLWTSCCVESVFPAEPSPQAPLPALFEPLRVKTTQAC